MDRERQRIEEDLRGLIAGEVRSDRVFRQLYATDASLFAMEPLAVVRPRTTADVVALVHYAANNGLPLHARGAGSGLAGGAVGPGIVIDFSHSMRRIKRLDEKSVRVQPGATLRSLNEHLAKSNRQFGPDPAKANVTTLGGMVAVDASGSHWLRSGSARRHITSMEVVLADGTVAEVGRCPIEPRTDGAGSPRLADLIRSTCTVLDRHAGLLTANRPKSLVNTSGYGLFDVMQKDSISISELIIGSEGTLALITGISLSTEPVAPHRTCVLLFFDRLEKAAESVPEVVSLSPSACDLMDRRHLNLAREVEVHFELMIPAAAEAVLLVEFEGADREEVASRLQTVIDRVVRKQKLAAGFHEASEPEDVALCWKLAQSFTPTLSRLKGESRPVPFVEDVAVPPTELGTFLLGAQEVLKRRQTTASLFAHAGHGQVHLRPFIAISDASERNRLVQLAADLYELAWKLGGTVSGEHGDGLSRTPYLKHQFGPLCEVFGSIKQIFDPQNLLNPGKIVPAGSIEVEGLLAGDAYPIVVAVPGSSREENSQRAKHPSSEILDGPAMLVADQPPDLVDLQLSWNHSEFASAIANCNRCGICREASTDLRMCPINHFAPREEASPRAKVNLLAAVLSGRLSREDLHNDKLKRIADLCVHCHMCRLECPAEVDVPRLMAEAKGAYVRENGMRPGEWVLTRIDRVCQAASRFPLLSNWVAGNRTTRWLAEKLLGISQSRKAPKFARQPFLRLAFRRGLSRPKTAGGFDGDVGQEKASSGRSQRSLRPRCVTYFVDTWANYFDVELASAFTNIVEHNGMSVFVPPTQLGAGMPLIANGAVEAAREVARQNVASLSEAVRQGHAIVATEPSATLAITREYPDLLPNDADVRAVADATEDACQFLWKLHLLGELRIDFRPLDLSLGYHVPCHLKALDIGTPSENLLRLVPGIKIERWEKGCTGMAGVFGLAKKNYRNSLRAGMPLISAIRASNVSAGATDCCTCKIQMEHASPTPTIHPIKLLAWAYGLSAMPVELAGAGKMPSGE